MMLSAIRQAGRFAPRLTTMAAIVLAVPAGAVEFSVTPIRVEFKSGMMSETLTVINHDQGRLRVAVKLMEWTQDENGNDVYKDSNDLIYFPRQLEIEPDGRRLVRVGAKAPAGVTERTYRLFIEEQPDPARQGQPDARAQLAFYFRFGVPIFLPPAVAKPQPEVLEPTLTQGKLAVVVKNSGNQNFRLNKLTVSDGATFTQDIAGWYSLANTTRTYSANIPRDVCQRAKTLSISLEGESIRIDRKLNVDPASCA